MPAFTTHYLLITSIEDRIQECDKNLKINEPALVLGAQGPDIFFFHRVWKMLWGGNLEYLGDKMHQCETSKLFKIMKDYLVNEKCDKDIIESYIYGFLSHYALDRNGHPFIYAMQDKIIKEGHYEHYMPSSVHGYVESMIDVEMLKNVRGDKDGRAFKGQDTISTDEHLVEELSKLMAYVVPKMFDINVDIKQYRLAYLDTTLVQKLLYDPEDKKKNFIKKHLKFLTNKIGPKVSGMMRPEKCDDRWDYLNYNHNEWAMVYDKTKKFNTSFVDIFNFAKDDTINLINAFNSENPQKAIKDIADDMSFDTGLNYKITEPLN